MKSKIQFLLSMIIFGTIGVFVRYIDLASSEIALLRSLIGSLFLIIVMLIDEEKNFMGACESKHFRLITFECSIGRELDFPFSSVQTYDPI